MALATAVVLITSGCSDAERHTTSTPPTVTIAQYPGNRQGAFSYSFDDGTASQPAIIAPLFERYGFRATFYICPGLVKEQQWNAWQRMVAHGHEIGNHTLTHVNCVQQPDAELDRQVNASADLLFTRLKCQALTFAYPFHESDDRTDRVVLERHLAIRSGDIAVTSTNCSAANLNALIDKAMTQRRWIIISAHGVDGDGYSPISSSELEQHLAYVRSRANDIYVDTIINILNYAQERDAAQVVLEEAEPGICRFAVHATRAAASTLSPLTVLIALHGMTVHTASARQGTTPIPVRIAAGNLVMDVMPDDSSITVLYQ